jgi:hypothetical protein
MTVTEITSKRGKTDDERDASRSVESESREPVRRRMRIIPVLITLATVALAALLGWAMWGSYMGAPWTRDSTVRAYIVTMAPEVAGRIVELPLVDNGYVRKGDLLMVIDPTNYKIAVNQAKAAVQLAEAGVQNIDAQINVQHARIDASQAQVNQAQAALVFAQQQAAPKLGVCGRKSGERSSVSWPMSIEPAKSDRLFMQPAGFSTLGGSVPDVTLIRARPVPWGGAGPAAANPVRGVGKQPGAQIKTFFGSPRLRAWVLDCLHRKFLEIYGREKKSRFDLPVSVLRGGADHHDRSDLERIRSASRHAEHGTRNIGHIDDGTSTWVVLLGIDSVDR